MTLPPYLDIELTKILQEIGKAPERMFHELIKWATKAIIAEDRLGLLRQKHEDLHDEYERLCWEHKLLQEKLRTKSGVIQTLLAMLAKEHHGDRYNH